MSEIIPFNFMKKINKLLYFLFLCFFNQLTFFSPIEINIQSNLHPYQALVDNVELERIYDVIRQYIDDDVHHLLFAVEYSPKTTSIFYIKA